MLPCVVKAAWRQSSSNMMQHRTSDQHLLCRQAAFATHGGKAHEVQESLGTRQATAGSRTGVPPAGLPERHAVYMHV